MKTITINSAKELKSINRQSITAINGVQFGSQYPMLEITNQHVSYYDTKTQSGQYIAAPFTVAVNN